jgi:hypothetical protein
VPTEGSDQLLPNRLQDLQEKDYPLFLTSRQMLCKLDASIGDPFFKREEDGSMKVIQINDNVWEKYVYLF